MRGLEFSGRKAEMFGRWSVDELSSREERYLYWITADAGGV